MASFRARDSGWIAGDTLVPPYAETNTTIPVAQAAEKVAFMSSPKAGVKLSVGASTSRVLGFSAFSSSWAMLRPVKSDSF
jgi:hypothetical protein